MTKLLITCLILSINTVSANDIEYIDLNTGKLIIENHLGSDIYSNYNTGELHIQNIEDGLKYDYNGNVDPIEVLEGE